MLLRNKFKNKGKEITQITVNKSVYILLHINNMTSMAIDNEEMAKNLKKRSDGAIIFSATNNNNNDDNDYNNNNNNNSSSSSSSSENIVSKSKNRMKKVKQIPSVKHCPRCNEKHDILYEKITLCNNCQNNIM